MTAFRETRSKVLKMVLPLGIIGLALLAGEEIITSQVPAAIPGLPLQTLDQPAGPAAAPGEPGPAPAASTE